MSLAWLYVLGAACELIGVALAALELRQSRIAWHAEFNAPQRPDEDAFFMFERIHGALEDVFTGNQARRLAAVALLATGVVIGLAGNLASIR